MRRRLTGFRDSGGYGGWELRADRPVLVLALVVVVVLVVPLLAPLPRAASVPLPVAHIVIWAAFAIDYGARLYLAPARWRFVRAHPLDLVVVVVPFLRPIRILRLLRLARLGAVAGVAHRRLQRSFHTAVAAYV